MDVLKQKTVDGTKLQLKKYADGRFEVQEDGFTLSEPFYDEDAATRYYEDTVADFKRRKEESAESMGGFFSGGQPQMPDFGGNDKAGGLPGFGMSHDDSDDDDDRGFPWM